jgi:hypothetical protein
LKPRPVHGSGGRRRSGVAGRAPGHESL